MSRDLLHQDEAHYWRIMFEPSTRGRARLFDSRSTHTESFEGTLDEVLAQACKVAWQYNGPDAEDDA